MFSGNWSAPLNWNPTTVPNASDANLVNGGTATVDSAVTNALTLKINSASVLNVQAGGALTADTGEIGDGSAGTINVSGGTLTFSNHVNFGTGGGIGIINQTGGTVNANGQWMAIGLGGGAAGSAYNLSGGTLATLVGVEVGSDRAGDMTISGTGLANIGGTVEVGVRNGSNGHLTVGSGTLNAASISIGSRQSLASGLVDMNGTGVINLTGALIVGNSGTGTFTQTGGTLNMNGNQILVGEQAGGMGTFNFSAWTINNLGSIFAGRNGGTGVFNQTGGTIGFNGGVQAALGTGAGSTGTINVSGGSTVMNNTSGADWQIGFNGGTGNFNVTAGGTVNHNWWLNVARGGGSVGNVKVDGTNSKIQLSAGQVNIGEDGIGTLEVKNGGKFSSTEEFSIGRNGGSNGTVTLAGAGSLIDLTGDIYVGRNGTGTFSQSNGTLDLHGRRIQVADGANSIGTVNLTGGTVANSQWFHVGSNLGSLGTVNMNYTDSATILQTDRIYVGNNNGTGIMNVQSGRLRLNTFGEVGRGGGTGTLNVSGAGRVEAFTGGSVDDFFRVGGIDGASGNGTVNITAGGQLTTNNGWLTMGQNDGSVGLTKVSGTGSSLTARGMIVGWSGSGKGTLTIENNAVATNFGHELSIGRDHANTEGIVNITSGGTLNAGNDARIGHNGKGTVNINAGTFNGQGGWIYIGDGGASNGTLNVTNGVFNNVAGTMIGNNVGAIGTVNVTGTSTFTSGEVMMVGRYGKGTFNQNGGVVNANQWMGIGGDGSGADGTYKLGADNVSGGRLNVASELYVGRLASTGLLELGTGSILSIGNVLNIAQESAAARGTVLNHGGAITVGGELNVGVTTAGAVGVYTQTSGSLTANGMGGAGGNDANTVGRDGATGTLSINGGTAQINGGLNVGRGGGIGEVNIGGGTMNHDGWLTVGRDGAGTGTVNVRNNGVYTHNQLGGDFLLGWQNGTHGYVNVESGGKMTHNWWLRIGIDGGSTGRLKVDGAGSLFKHNDGTGGDSRFYIGEGGAGELIISNGGQLIHGGAETRVGWHNGSNGKVDVNTGGILTLNNGSLLVGNESGSLGTVDVKSGGKVSVNNGWLQIGESAGSTGTVTVDGVGSRFEHDLVNAGHSMSIGQSGTGTLIIRNGAVFNDGGSRVLVGRDNTGVGSLQVLSGGTFNHSIGYDSDDWSLFIGGTHEAAGTGRGTATVSGTGSTLNSNAIHIGRSGATGYFNIADNGTVNTIFNVEVGLYGGNGTVNKTGGTLNVNRDLVVGRSATGSFTNSGGTSNVNGFYVGINSGAVGTVNITGGTVQNNGWVDIGRNGTGTVNVEEPTARFLGSISDMQVGYGAGGLGTVNITNGGQMTHNWWINLGRGGGSTGNMLVDGVGSKLTQGTRVDTQDSRFNIGADPNDGANVQTGTLTISDHGLVERTALGGEVNVGRNAGSTGTVNIEGGGRFTNAGGTAFIGVNGGTGFLSVSDPGSEFSINGELYAGFNGGSNGTIEQYDGLVASNNLRVGTNSALGTYSMFDGTITVPGDLTIGWQGTATGAMTISGGTATVNTDTYVGVDGTASGTLNIDGGTLITGHLIVARDAANTGTVQLDGDGTLATNFMTNAAGTAQVNFNGGTVRARSNRVNFFEGFTTANSQLQTGGLLFDSAGFSASATNAFDGPGGITKVGTGTLALAGPNVYSGDTSVQGGTLLLGASNVIPDVSALKLSSGATLATGGFSDSTGPLSVTGTAIIDMAGGDSVLTFANVGTWTSLLNVLNYTGASWTLGTDKLIFTAGSGSINLANVEFYSDNGITKIGSGGGGLIGIELVPVPEPAAILATSLLGLAILRRETRRRRI